MSTRNQAIFTAISLVLMALGLMSNEAFSFPVGTPVHDEERLVPMRQAGMQPTPERVSELVAIVREKPIPSRFLMETTLLSLGQIGEASALPDINALIGSGSSQSGDQALDPNIINAAKAARARIMAEDIAGADTTSPAQAQTELDTFFRALGETPTDLNAAMTAYNAEVAKPGGPDVAPKYPVELYALRQLSDMAYHSAYKDFVKLPGIAQVRFDLDPRSAIKARLAPLSQTERAYWLVEDLSAKATFGDTENAEAQLAGDLGLLANSVASAKLKEMSQHRERYKKMGFHGLFDVLTRAGDKNSLQPDIEKFKTDHDPAIAEDARDGGRGNFVAGY